MATQPVARKSVETTSRRKRPAHFLEVVSVVTTSTRTTLQLT